MFHVKQYEVIVVGGGHAGCEAALACARMGLSTALITLDAQKIAEMSCNPSIGGVGKGQLTKEIDALGGEMGRNADFTGIQFKRLNTRKGSAVQSSRCQSDKRQYALRMQGVVKSQPKLTVVEAEVKSLTIDVDRVTGVEIALKGGGRETLSTSAVVITSGTFMRGLMHCGELKTAGGRFGERSAEGISDCLRDVGLRLLRLKTGTPPRLLAGSIDFSQMERQPGDTPPRKFSFWPSQIELPQVDCFLTYTNPATHEAIRAGLDRSPLYSGQIKGVGPRYCPSIEDKVVKFPQKERHQLFFEPEALDSDWIYPNGVSTSLPPDIQDAFLRTIPGCADVKVARHGYAVEYDCIEPSQLKHSLETKAISGLFFGGQVNGTSGYEEAAAQGLMAGINAALSVQSRPPLILSRAEAYIGVMIDDLVTMGVTEPYRMFTSRAEFRLSLREDNADFRLARRGYECGLLPEAHHQLFLEKAARVQATRVFLADTVVKPSPALDEKLEALGSSPLSSPQPLAQIAKRPELGLSELLQMVPAASGVVLSPDEQENLEIEIKYEGYIAIQRDEIARLDRLRHSAIPELLDFAHVAGLSFEIRDKLGRARPKTLADAAHISGVTPAAIAALAFHLRQKNENPARTV